MSLKRLALAWRSVRLPWRKETLMGVDRNGNEYYESFAKRENTGRTRRWVKTLEEREELYEERQVPVQWQSWLRHRRPVPPSQEEMIWPIYDVWRLFDVPRKLIVNGRSVKRN
ncbi:hypothetical protein BDF22DRAFT_733367 [Syncephalis plumigaleata]|nr:hypothetical protein BDF22DRAFT_733367 [Syncephalis plumigaleata]